MKQKSMVSQVCWIVLVFFLMAGWSQIAYSEDAAKFISIPLGVTGGLREDNISSYLLAPKGSTDFIALDAGTLFAGLRQARILESFEEIELPPDSELTLEGLMMQQYIKAYLISHAHIDHVAGLVLNAPDDGKKDIIGISSTIDNIRDHLFNWKIWPNFGDEGEGFQLKKYHYVRLTPGETSPINGTSMKVTSFLLSHSNYTSSAFLIEADGAYMLYFGDTGPDEVEKSDYMRQIWTHVAPLVRNQQLKGIFLEVSYPDERADDQLFGHLTPKWMMKELSVLANLVNPQHPETALRGLKVVVTHIKPSFVRDMPVDEKILKQLHELNTLNVRFIIPEQGERLEF